MDTGQIVLIIVVAVVVIAAIIIALMVGRKKRAEANRQRALDLREKADQEAVDDIVAARDAARDRDGAGQGNAVRDGSVRDGDRNA